MSKADTEPEPTQAKNREDPASTQEMGSDSTSVSRSTGSTPADTLPFSPAENQGPVETGATATQPVASPKPLEADSGSGETQEMKPDARQSGNLDDTQPIAGSSEQAAPLEAKAGHEGTGRSRFRVLRTHARGGLGQVYVAHDAELKREVALKEILGRWANDPNSRARFLLEAEITGALEHPGVVPVYSLGQDGYGRFFYAMRFIRGESLEQAITRFHEVDQPICEPGQRTLEFRQLLRRFVDVCDTIAYAHSRGVIHRDIKPSNVMLGPFGETLVVDWGLAKCLDRPDLGAAVQPKYWLSGSSSRSTDTLPGSALGTPAYMSPEQAAGRLDLSGPAGDVYSLGATLFVLLTGRAPFLPARASEILASVQRGDFPRPRDVESGIPPPLEAICLKSMALLPEDRYDSPRSLAAEIELWMADEPVSVFRESRRQRLARWARRHRTWTQAGAAALLAITVIAVASALAVSAARHRENAARAREDNQRQLTDLLRKERQEHLQALRATGEELLLQGQRALDGQDWPQARLQLSKAIATVRPEPELADLTARAESLKAETEQRLALMEARQAARDTYVRFQKGRDDALYHGTLFTGLDRAANLEATKTAAREALGLYGIADEGAAKAPILDKSDLDDLEQDEVKTGCYELLLVLAEAEGQSWIGLDGENRLDTARRALSILDRTSVLGIPTRSYYARRAQYLDQLGDHEGALKESAKAAATEPTLAVDFFLLGEQQYKQGALENAIQNFEAALRLRPDHFWAQYFLAVSHLKAEPARPSEARAYLTSCISRRPGFAWTYLLRGYAAGELGEFDAAEADFTRAMELSKDDGVHYGVLVNRGAMRIRRGTNEQAMQDLVRAIQLKPNQYQAHANLGLAYRNEERWAEALEQFDIAIRLAPDQSSLYHNRGLISLNRQDLAAALSDFEQAINLASGPIQSVVDDHVQRGRILHRQKRYAEALAAYEAALKLQPGNRTVERLRADTLLALGRGSEALIAFDVYLEPTDTDPDAYRQRGFERARVADYAGAQADFTRALVLEPDSPSTRARRGWSFLNDATKLALSDFEAAIKLDPRNGDLHNGRGYARVLLGDYAGGVADAEEALRLSEPIADVRIRLATQYNAACIFAQAAGKTALATGDPERQALARRYRDRSLELIRQALDLLDPPARQPYLKQLAGDPAFDPIRSYPPFKQLIAGPTPPANSPSAP
jgi:eukaryotic-like serine/threonine-protein kinase